MQYQNSCCQRSEKESCLEQYPIAMAYVPWQKFDKSFSLCHALKVGTIFPCLEQTTDEQSTSNGNADRQKYGMQKKTTAGQKEFAE